MNASQIISIVGAVAATISAILVLVTYRLNQMPASTDTEIRIEQRLSKPVTTDGVHEIEVVDTQAVVWDSWKNRLKRWILFQQTGETMVLVKVYGDDVPENFTWDEDEFRAECENFQIEAEQELVTQKYPPLVRISFETVDHDRIVHFLRNLTSRVSA